MYNNYNADDLIEAPGFDNWVRKQDRKSEAFWENWIIQNPEKKSEVEKARAIILSMGVTETPVSNGEMNALWNKIDSGINKNERKGFWRPGFSFYKIAVAAAIAGVLVTIGLFESNSLFDEEQAVPETQVAMVEKICKAGEKSTITLMDGTRIKLNSGSKLIFPESFSSTARDIRLEGEAYFDVAHDPSRPFTIISGDVKTRVLGTSFNVQAYPSRNHVKVAVETGKVSVKTEIEGQEPSSLTLLPNDMAIFYKNSNEMSKSAFDRDEEFAWKDGVLFFKNKDIHYITAELAKWYGVSFVFDKNINTDKDYSGSYDNNSLEEVLTGLSFVFDFEFEIENKVATIK